MGALLGHTATESILRQHGVAQMVNLERLSEGLSVGADTSHRSATIVHAVVTLLPTDETGFRRLTF